MAKRKICVVLTDRANFGRMWPVMKAIQSHDALELVTMCTGSMVLERFGGTEKLLEEYGFSVDSRVYMELEGSVPTTMAKSIGYGITEITSELNHINPDILLLIGDRYEALAATIAAAYQNICIAHIQGGEVSGSIDESARHAITKFAQYHFPATKRSTEFIIRMGENPDNVFNVGCPCGDFVIDMNTDIPQDTFNKLGIGAQIDPDKPFFLVAYHPITTEYGKAELQVKQLITALDTLQHPTVWLWPNIDAGADHISHALRIYREQHGDTWLRLIKNIEPTMFQRVLKKCACAIGNSSSFVRDSSFSGTPVVLVGDRQFGREYADNVIKSKSVSDEILSAINKQLVNGRYQPSKMYGDGTASGKIVSKLAEVKLYRQKRLHYIYK